jgi:hypothetical protein
LKKERQGKSESREERRRGPREGSFTGFAEKALYTFNFHGFGFFRARGIPGPGAILDAVSPRAINTTSVPSILFHRGDFQFLLEKTS